MTRYLLRFAYLGTRYRGLQRDNSNPLAWDSDTVQGAVECALSALKPPPKTKPHLLLSSRTDSGVHALSTTAHVDIENEQIYDPISMAVQANFFFTYCRHDIRIQEIIPVTNEFHARRNTESRTYVYRFITPKDNFNREISILDAQYNYVTLSPEFDIEKAKSAAKLFEGLWDFRTFCSTEVPNHKKPVRTLDICTITEAQSFTPYDPRTQNFHYWALTFKSRGFLYKQVRRMSAAIVGCATGRITERDLKIMLQVPGRHNWNTKLRTLPAHGLQLVNVEYDPKVIERCRIK